MAAAVASVVVAVGMGALLLAPPALAATSHEFTTTFAGSGTDALNDPTDVAVDNSTGPSAHDVYVADTGNHRIEKFSPTGEFILMFGKEVNETTGGNVCIAASGNTCKAGASASIPSGAFESPTFVAVDNSSGDVYVGDTSDNLISKFSEEGKLVSNWGSGGELKGSPTETFGPLAGIAVDDTGNLFVYGVDERMFRFESSGSFVTSFATLEEADFAVRREIAQSGIAVDAQDNLYKVTTSGVYGIPGYIGKLSESGLSLGRVAEENPTGLAMDVDSNELYVDAGGASISDFLNGGKTLANSFGSPHLQSAKGLSVDVGSEIIYAATPAKTPSQCFRHTLCRLSI